MSETAIYDLAFIKEILPHRSPFLFVDRITEFNKDKNIVAEKDICLDEPFFAGHFPGRPIMPGVLVSEALAQTCGLLLGLPMLNAGKSADANRPAYFLAGVNMKYLAPVLPEQILSLEAGLVKGFSGLFMFDVSARVQDMLIAKGTLTLAEERAGSFSGQE